MFPDWPPIVGEFIQACRPGLIPENAFHDAVAGMAARRCGEVGQRSNPAVYWAAMRVGSHYLLNCGYSVMQSRWERALSEELNRGEWAPTPVPAVALPTPGATHATPEEAAKELKAMRRTRSRTRLDAIRAGRRNASLQNRSDRAGDGTRSLLLPWREPRWTLTRNGGCKHERNAAEQGRGL